MKPNFKLIKFNLNPFQVIEEGIVNRKWNQPSIDHWFILTHNQEWIPVGALNFTMSILNCRNRLAMGVAFIWEGEAPFASSSSKGSLMDGWIDWLQCHWSHRQKKTMTHRNEKNTKEWSWSFLIQKAFWCRLTSI